MPGAVYNVGGGSRVSLRHCLDTIIELVGQGRIEHGQTQVGDVRHTYADAGRIRAQLGWEPQVTLAEGLERQVAWHREQLRPAVGTG